MVGGSCQKTSQDECVMCGALVPLLRPCATLCLGCARLWEEACRCVGLAAGLLERLDLEPVIQVQSLLRKVDHQRTDVTVDLQQPFRAKAWPSTVVCPQRWDWQDILSLQWTAQGAHVHQFDLHAWSSHVRWVARF